MESVNCWLESKRLNDHAEGLWRIHNSLYDLTDFIKYHPGGSDWLSLTKGTDITEAFETHHLNMERVKCMLEKFLIRHSNNNRMNPLTFNENQFYYDLKRRVREKMHDINQIRQNDSKSRTDMLFISFFVLAILSLKMQCMALAILSGICLSWTMVCAHQFIHQKNNSRLLYLNYMLLNYKDIRVSHVLSHHMYLNSVNDIELLMFEPLSTWIPSAKMKQIIATYFRWIYEPFMWSIMSIFTLFLRLLTYGKGRERFHKRDYLGLTLPIAMYILGCSNIILTIKWWFFILTVASFVLGWIGFNKKQTYEEEDSIREPMDFGLYILKMINKQNGSMQLTKNFSKFAQNSLHYLFPTIDCNILYEFYPILHQTMKEHNHEVQHTISIVDKTNF